MAFLAEAGWELCGLVSGADVVHIPGQPWSSGTAEVKALSFALSSLREQALKKMMTAALTRGAQGIIDAQLEIRDLRAGQHLPGAIVTGTGVRRSDRTASPGTDRDPFVTTLRPVELVLLGRAGYEPVGMPMGTCVYSADRVAFGRWVNGRQQNVELDAYTQALYQARELAMTRLQDQARRYEADGVIGIQTAEKTHSLGSHIIEFFASGTAVRRTSAAADPLTPRLATSLNDALRKG